MGKLCRQGCQEVAIADEERAARVTSVAAGRLPSRDGDPAKLELVGKALLRDSGGEPNCFPHTRRW